jgi:hypothetical protein
MKAFIAPGSESSAAIAIFKRASIFADFSADAEAWSGMPADEPGALEILFTAPGACSKCGGGRVVQKVQRQR